MASTYSTLKVELIGTGEQTGTWGTTTNNNFSVALGDAITGSADVAFSSADVTVTLTDTNGAQTARNLRLNLTGTSGGARNLILGSGCQIEKLYLVNNGLADAVTVKNTSGTGIAVPAGKSMFVYNNGTNVVDVVTHLTSLTLGTALPVSSGGSGLATLTANNVLIGNGTGNVTFVAPSTTGNVLTSNGTTWNSTAPAAGTTFSAGTTGFTPNTATSGAVTLSGTLAVANGGTGGTTQATARSGIGAGTGNGNGNGNGNGTVTSVATGNGLSGGTITSTGTLVVACPTADTVGSYAMGFGSPSPSFSFGSNYSVGVNLNQFRAGFVYNAGCYAQISYTDSLISGTWKWMSGTTGSQSVGLICRVS